MNCANCKTKIGELDEAWILQGCSDEIQFCKSSCADSYVDDNALYIPSPLWLRRIINHIADKHTKILT